MVINIV